MWRTLLTVLAACLQFTNHTRPRHSAITDPQLITVDSIIGVKDPLVPQLHTSARTRTAFCGIDVLQNTSSSRRTISDPDFCTDFRSRHCVVVLVTNRHRRHVAIGRCERIVCDVKSRSSRKGSVGTPPLMAVRTVT